MRTRLFLNWSALRVDIRCMSSSHAFQCRLLERVQVGGLPVEWNVRPSARSLHRGADWVESRVVDASAGGVCVAAPVVPDVSIGSLVMIGAEGWYGLVRVEWERDTADPRVKYFGVSFVDVGPVLTDYLTTPLPDPAMSGTEG